MHLLAKLLVMTLLVLVNNNAASQDNITGGKAGIEGAKIGADGSTVENTVGKFEKLGNRLNALEIQNQQRIDEVNNLIKNVEHLEKVIQGNDQNIKSKSVLIEKQQEIIEKQLKTLEEQVTKLRRLEESLENASADVETSTTYVKNQQAFLDKLEKKLDKGSEVALAEIKSRTEQAIKTIDDYVPDFESQLNEQGVSTKNDINKLEVYVVKQVDDLKAGVTKQVDELKNGVEKQIDAQNNRVTVQIGNLNNGITDQFARLNEQTKELVKEINNIKSDKSLTESIVIILAFLAVFGPTAQYLGPKINKFRNRKSSGSNARYEDKAVFESSQSAEENTKEQTGSKAPLLEEARSSFKRSDFDTAASIAEKIIKSGSSQNIEKIEAHILTLKIYLELKNWFRCINMVEQVIADFPENELRIYLPYILVSKARCLQNLNKFEKAGETYDDALGALSNQDEPILEPEAYCGSIECWNRTKNVGRTQWLINKFHAKYEEIITPKNQRQFFKISLIQAELKLNEGNIRPALKILNGISLRFKDNEDIIIRSYVVDSVLLLSECYVKLGEMDKAITFLWQVVEQYIKKGNGKLESKLLSPIVKACVLSSTNQETRQAVDKLVNVMEYYDSKKQEYSVLTFLRSTQEDLNVKTLLKACKKSTKHNEVTKFEIKKALRMLPDSILSSDAHFAFFNYFTTHRNLSELEDDLKRLDEI